MLRLIVIIIDYTLPYDNYKTSTIHSRLWGSLEMDNDLELGVLLSQATDAA